MFIINEKTTKTFLLQIEVFATNKKKSIMSFTVHNASFHYSALSTTPESILGFVVLIPLGIVILTPFGTLTMVENNVQ